MNPFTPQIASLADPFCSMKLPIEQAHHLPGAIYSTDEYFQLEKERIFLAEWLMVCREEELKNSGDYFTTRIMGEAVLVVRNKEGVLVALANACRHRGVEVATGEGTARLFVCPYHAWTYELDGRLKAAPSLGPGRSKPEDCNLHRFALKTWGGCVFINMSPSPRSFEEFIAPFDAEFGFLKLENTVLARKVEFDIKCNWKLALENLIDIYHVGTVHAKTFGGHYSKNKDDFTFNLMNDGSLSFFENAAPMTPTGKSLVGSIPWLSDQPESFAGVGLLWPNIRLSARIDYLRVWSIWPTAPDRVKMVAHMLFAPEALEQPDFEAKVDSYEQFIRAFIEEDRAMVESLQLGVSSHNYDPGPLSHLETGIRHFLNHYLDVVGA